VLDGQHRPRAGSDDPLGDAAEQKGALAVTAASADGDGVGVDLVGVVHDGVGRTADPDGGLEGRRLRAGVIDGLDARQRLPALLVEGRPDVVADLVRQRLDPAGVDDVQRVDGRPEADRQIQRAVGGPGDALGAVGQNGNIVTRPRAFSPRTQRFVAVGQSLLGEFECNSASDSCCTAGHDCCLAFQSHTFSSGGLS